MDFGLFYEFQLPRPWEPEHERKLLQNALDQIALADRLGFHYVWQVEHHFLEEYSHSSAPEVFLAAVSQRTNQIRLGHGIVQIPPGINHPARVAERVATLDLLSNGRVELGTGEASSAAELGGFLIEREQKRAQWEDAIDAITRMFVEEPFAGHASPFFRMPPRNVVPKPYQKPHPPLWVACSRRETIQLAARKGLGALSFSFVEPEEAGRWVREYYALLASPACVPAGFSVNPNLAVVLPMMLHEDEHVAIERGIDGAHFFHFSLAHYYGLARHQPARTDVWQAFQAKRDSTGFSRSEVHAAASALGVKVLQASGFGSLRGAIGTPAQVVDLLRRYQNAGVDQVIFVMQTGLTQHEHICESLELFARHVLPVFAAERQPREQEKRQRLAPAIAAALSRRLPPRTGTLHTIDEPSEVSAANAARTRVDAHKPRVRDAVRRRMQALLANSVRGKSDAQLESTFGSPWMLRALFAGMARGFNPQFAFGFQGKIAYELLRGHGHNGRANASHWTVEVEGSRARARPVASSEAALRVKIPLVDFVRVMAGELPPLAPLLEGRAEMEGDLGLSSRLSELFGGPPNL